MGDPARMRLSSWAWLLLAGAAAAVGVAVTSCANGIVVDDGADASTSEAGLDASGCPDADLATDPKHCGGCNIVCQQDEVCSGAACKKQCDAPLVKCPSVQTCVDLKTDTDHCGTCATICPAVSDGGGIPPGTNNPDAGIPFDGGFDAGPGWSVGSPACEAGTCAIACPPGMTACSDGVCYDTQNHHDHCGDCSTACAADTEWCSSGKCCPVGQLPCNGVCTDVLGDPNNCGACGNVCQGQNGYCGGGVCGTGVIYTENFPNGTLSSSSQQCLDWNTFRGKLTGTFTGIKITGTNDQVGISCTGSSANTICQALHNNTTVSVACNGHTWQTGPCGNGQELSADGTTCQCDNPGYIVRPCINNLNWGGVNTNTCGAPTQTMTVTCY